MSGYTLLLFIISEVVIIAMTFWRIEATRRSDYEGDQRVKTQDMVKVILAPELRDIDRRLSNIEGQLGVRSRSR